MCPAGLHVSEYLVFCRKVLVRKKKLAKVRTIDRHTYTYVELTTTASSLGIRATTINRTTRYYIRRVRIDIHDLEKRTVKPTRDIYPSMRRTRAWHSHCPPLFESELQYVRAYMAHPWTSAYYSTRYVEYSACTIFWQTAAGRSRFYHYQAACVYYIKPCGPPLVCSYMHVHTAIRHFSPIVKIKHTWQKTCTDKIGEKS